MLKQRVVLGNAYREVRRTVDCSETSITGQHQEKENQSVHILVPFEVTELFETLNLTLGC